MNRGGGETSAAPWRVGTRILLFAAVSLTAACGPVWQPRPTVCVPTCANGLALDCARLQLDAGARARTFCPFGCAADGRGCAAVLEGGTQSCVGSHVMVEQGLLQSAAPVAASAFLAGVTRVVIGASSLAACAAMSGDAALARVAPEGAESFLVITLPASAAGAFPVSPEGTVSAQRWTPDGGVVLATAGSVSVGQLPPNGGVEGIYALTFGGAVEQGVFAAPSCNVCTVAGH